MNLDLYIKEIKEILNNCDSIKFEETSKGVYLFKTEKYKFAIGITELMPPEEKEVEQENKLGRLADNLWYTIQCDKRIYYPNKIKLWKYFESIVDKRILSPEITPEMAFEEILIGYDNHVMDFIKSRYK